MTIDNVKRSVLQKGIRLGIVQSNRIERIKNFVVEKKSIAAMTIVKFFSSANDENRLGTYYDFKEAITIMKALRLEIIKRTLTADKINGQKIIDDMSLEYRQTVRDLLGLYLLKCSNTVNTDKYNSEDTCEQVYRLIYRNEYMNQLPHQK